MHIIRYLCLFVLCIGVLLIYIDALYPLDRLDSIQKNVVYLVKHIVHAFTVNNICFWACGGTLLGAVRDKHMIVWDDDADFCVHVDDISRIENIDLSDYGNIVLYKVRHYWYKIKIPNRTGFVDIFGFCKNNNRYEYANKFCKEYWPNGWFGIDEIEKPFSMYNFGQLQVPGPQDATLYFDRHYGKNWNIPKFDCTQLRHYRYYPLWYLNEHFIIIPLIVTVFAVWILYLHTEILYYKQKKTVLKS
jgi:phosphorylcholine metabolism protein LicD